MVGCSGSMGHNGCDPMYNPSVILQTAVGKTDSTFLHTMMGLTLIFNVKGKNKLSCILLFYSREISDSYCLAV